MATLERRKNMRKYIATIELDNDLGRGKIFTEINEDGDHIILVELPGGTVEEPAIAPCKADDVDEYIDLAWGGSVWDLEWIEE